VTERPPLGYVLQVWTAPNPQGFAYRQYGSSKRELCDFEGIALMLVKKNTRKKKGGVQKPRETA
jgi:hypothetical protein